ncbi:WecB/TagA/CpsF family glycosyltransferase [uncultured Bacteroides sp.]|uniref:WecB/TagA/CpsF family glycosyltransferase n=1 Tax=uncultured Bacteroides sp. TaxID=162156 RepID=UPI002AAA96EA|nr:WecB/TagA/CpsF family glycosyltransferase [uncultured Bacteroides sp.]
MSRLNIKNIQLLQSQDRLADLPIGKLLVNTINAHSYNTARKDPLFAEALLKGDVLLPDGASIVKAMKWLQGKTIERTAGWDLFVWEMANLEQRAKNSEQKQKKVFFLGSHEAILEKIKQRAAEEYPHLDVYTYSPPYKLEFSEKDNREMIAAVNRVQPHLLWIGMTAPKQEKWAYSHLRELEVKGHIGTIGAVFDFYAGTVERAPLWWQENSLEWLYRLIKEPKRMWRRYIIGNTLFLLNISKEYVYSKIK